MKVPPDPPNEQARLRALRNMHVLDTMPEQVYDDLTQLAAYVCETPIALVSLVDENRQWFKSRVGLEVEETTRDESFCAHAVASGEMLLVQDSLADERFADNPLVLSDPNVRFYAGTPLITGEGHALGTVCVIDHIPRDLLPEQIEMLRAIGRQVVTHLELRIAKRAAEQAGGPTSQFMAHVSQSMRESLKSVIGFTDVMLSKTEAETSPLDSAQIESVRGKCEHLLTLVDMVKEQSQLESDSSTLD
ncbi:MAG: GAF domain-containing protein [Candidatus Eisenbacteria bacterium]|uniref:GAF domain-containing protein n=1 Tax=Eiseniibacteriota bacterium TaxID=2212470 RepID=A0A7Y2E8X0_UNCEI|nr:GAF domain-containing protein [Candidatus Eisenbacteria bacterium]